MKAQVTAKTQPTAEEKMRKAHEAVVAIHQSTSEARAAIDRYLKQRGVTLGTLVEQSEGFRRDCYGAIRDALESGDWSTLNHVERFDPLKATKKAEPVVETVKVETKPETIIDNSSAESLARSCPKEAKPETKPEPVKAVAIEQRQSPESMLADIIRQIAGASCDNQQQTKQKQEPAIDMAEVRRIVQEEAVKIVRQQFSSMMALLGSGGTVSAVSEATAKEPINTPEKIADWMRGCDAGRPDQESFWVITLDRKNYPKNRRLITIGTLTSSLVHPREVFRAAIEDGAAAIVCVHQHPSGDPSPSQADVSVTRQLRETGKLLGIELSDHIIIGTKERDPSGLGYYSFHESGLC